MRDDERMLQRLGQALVPPPVEPSDAEVRRLRRAVARLRTRWAEDHVPGGRAGRAGSRKVVLFPPVVMHRTDPPAKA